MSNSRFSNGWKLATSSLSVLKKNKQLMVFPLLSTFSLVVLVASFIALSFAANGFDVFDGIAEGSVGTYVLLFLFYLVNYFIIVL